MRYILVLLFCALVLSPAAAAGATKSATSLERSYFVEIKQLMIPVFNKNGDTGVIVMELSAEVAEDSDTETIRANMPKIRDAYIRTVYNGVQDRSLLNKNGQLDILAIKKRLVAISNYVLHEELVKDVLLKSFNKQGF